MLSQFYFGSNPIHGTVPSVTDDSIIIVTLGSKNRYLTTDRNILRVSKPPMCELPLAMSHPANLLIPLIFIFVWLSKLRIKSNS